MRVLLPNQFKIIGSVIAPLGFAAWLGCQLGFLDVFLGPWPDSLAARRVILVSGAFAFLFGLYFVAFSKERMEDELIKRIRLESFLFAAHVQFIIIFSFFVLTLIAGDLKRGGFELFMILTILAFWVSFVLRFNYSLHITHRPWSTQ